VDLFNAKVVQAAMGSIMRVQVCYQEINDFMQNFSMYKSCVAVLDGKSIHEVQLPDKALLIFGNESRGISAELQSRADLRLTIPRKGKAESLNVAIAAAIVLSTLHP
jgi:TrmH family RNA methyltransferase